MNQLTELLLSKMRMIYTRDGENLKKERKKDSKRERRLQSLTCEDLPLSQFQCEPWMDSLHFCTNKHHKLMMMMKASESIKCPWAAYMAREQPLVFFFLFWQFNKKKITALKKENKVRTVFFIFFQYRIWKTWKLTSLVVWL